MEEWAMLNLLILTWLRFVKDGLKDRKKVVEEVGKVLKCILWVL
jgi:hypothetical protein